MSVTKKLNVKERVRELWKAGVKDPDHVAVVINQELEYGWIEKETYKDYGPVGREVIKQYIDDFEDKGSRQ